MGVVEMGRLEPEVQMSCLWSHEGGGLSEDRSLTGTNSAPLVQRTTLARAKRTGWRSQSVRCGFRVDSPAHCSTSVKGPAGDLRLTEAGSAPMILPGADDRPEIIG